MKYEFQVGDIVTHSLVDPHFKARIVNFNPISLGEDSAFYDQVVTIEWLNGTGLGNRVPALKKYLSLVCREVPVPYNPSQQGDTEDDV